jgi:hypothetical protein
MRTNIARPPLTFAALILFATAQGAFAGSDRLTSTDPGDGIRKYGDAGEPTYLTVELENVRVTSYQLGVLDNSAGEVAIETLEISHEGFVE